MAKPLGSSLTADGNVARWFGHLMLETAEAAGIKVSETRTRVYAADLADLPAEQVIDAVRRIRKEGSGFFPSVAEIRRQIVATPDDQALLAWTAFERAAVSVGAYQSVDVEDTVAAAALVQVFGSWPEWCAQETGPELLTKRQQFFAAYREQRRRQRAAATRLGATLPAITDETPTRLLGLLEGNNRYVRSPAVFIGRITALGQVLSVRDQSALPEAQQRRALPPQEDSNGQED
jgi:hypothetical protein